MAQTADLTLDELRLELAPRIAQSAIFDGWSDAALVSASHVAGVDPAVARLAFPDGAMDMIAAWIASVDARMAAAFD
ncbi:MAG: COQ9 family protein, partial [Porphyrobacter sp.]|nr:COQ9 family protein [Porphyrobacter sp.]